MEDNSPKLMGSSCFALTYYYQQKLLVFNQRQIICLKNVKETLWLQLFILKMQFNKLFCSVSAARIISPKILVVIAARKNIPHSRSIHPHSSHFLLNCMIQNLFVSVNFKLNHTQWPVYIFTLHNPEPASRTQSSGSNVCGNQNVRSTVTKLPENVITLLLALVAVHANCGPSHALDVFRHVLHLLFGLYKNNCLRPIVGAVRDLLQQIIESESKLSASSMEKTQDGSSIS